MTLAYMNQAWFTLLKTACEAKSRKQVADALAFSAPVISQVLNGSGKYGSGLAKTDKVAERVMHVYGRYPCPHLSEQHPEPVAISADECRAYAHQDAPIGSPRAMQHWQACLKCPHKDHTAPATPRESKPRGARVHRLRAEE